MLPHYVKLAVKVLLRRKFFTFISLFAISFTLVVLIVVAAILDHRLAPRAPEVYLDRTLYVNWAEMAGEHMSSNGNPGYALLDRYARDVPGVERFAIASAPKRVVSYVSGRKLVSRLKRTDAVHWDVLRFDFAEGGPFAAQDAHDADPVAGLRTTSRRRLFDAAATRRRTVPADG